MVTTRSVPTGVDLPYITSITPQQKGLALQINTIINRIQQELAAHAQAINNLPPGNLNAGINASSSTFWRGDGTWASPATQIATPGTTVVGDAVTWGNTTGTSLTDTTWTTVTQTKLTLFSSTQQGVVPSSSGFATSGSYLGGDVAWHTLPTVTQNFLYLGTVTVSGGTLSDTTILANNNSAYRSFKLIVSGLVPTNANVQLSIQVHSGGTFQTGATSYFSTVSGSLDASASSAGSHSTGSIIFVPAVTGAISTSDPGYAGEWTVTNLSSTTVHKIWHGHGGTFGTLAGHYGFAGYWNGGTGAIDGFQVVPNAGTLTSGTIDIYGML